MVLTAGWHRQGSPLTMAVFRRGPSSSPEGLAMPPGMLADSAFAQSATQGHQLRTQARLHLAK